MGVRSVTKPSDRITGTWARHNLWSSSRLPVFGRYPAITILPKVASHPMPLARTSVRASAAYTWGFSGARLTSVRRWGQHRFGCAGWPPEDRWAFGPLPVGRKNEHRRTRMDFGAVSWPVSVRVPEALCGGRRVVWLSPWAARGRGWRWVAGLRCGLTGLRCTCLGFRLVLSAAGPAWGPLPFNQFHDKSSI